MNPLDTLDGLRNYRAELDKAIARLTVLARVRGETGRVAKPPRKTKVRVKRRSRSRQ